MNEDSLPVEVKDQKIELAGKQISVFEGELDLYDDLGNHTGLNDKDEIETNIPDTSFNGTETSRHAFIKKGSKKITVKVKAKKDSQNSTNKSQLNLKSRIYRQDSVSKIALYKNIEIPPTSQVQFNLDADSDISPILQVDNKTIFPTSETTGSTTLDHTPPTTSIQISGTKDPSGIYSGPVTITLTGNDSGSGILKIEYSLDNGTTVQTYTNPFIISNPGKTIIQVKSIDKLGNEEIPQTITIEMATPPSPTPTPASSTNSSTSGTSSTNSNSSATDTQTVIASEAKQSSTSITSPPSVLGIEFENPSHISDEINVSNILGEQKESNVNKITGSSAKQILGGLLVVSAGIVTIASLSLATTFFLKPTPK